MNTDGTLARPSVRARANAGSACICVIPSYPCQSAFPLYCPGQHTHTGLAKERQVGKRRRQAAVEHVGSVLIETAKSYQSAAYRMSIEISSRLAGIRSVSSTAIV
jgi:hypothetical protein